MADQKIVNQHIIELVHREKGWKKVKTTVTAANKTMTKYERTTKRGNETFKQTAVVTEKAGKKTARYSEQLKTSARRTNDFVKALKRVVLVLPIWAATRAIIQGVTRLIKSSIRFLIGFEAQMAKVRIVGKSTNEEFARFERQLLDLAVAYGATSEQLGEAAILWRQQGKSLQEVIPLMETTIKLSLITGRSMKESVEDLTAIMKNFGIAAEDSTIIVDKLTKVMLNHAITTDVMIGALRDAAPVARQFGVSLEKLMGIITATHIATRAKGQRIGKAWRTIFSRMATTAKKSIQEIAKVPLFLDKAGEVTFRNTGTFRKFGEVLDELSIAFNGLSNETQANLAYTIAGRRRLELLLAAFQNWEEGIDASIEALKAFGDSTRAVDILLDTVEAKQKQLTNTWNRFVATLVTSTGSMKDAIDTLKRWVDSYTDAVQAMRGREFLQWALDVRETEKAFANIDKSLSLIIGRYKAMVHLSEELLVAVERANRLQEGTSKESQRRYRETLELVNKIKDALREEERFEAIIDLPLDKLKTELETGLPNLADIILSKEAQRNLIKRDKELTTEILSGWGEVITKLKEVRESVTATTFPTTLAVKGQWTLLHLLENATDLTAEQADKLLMIVQRMKSLKNTRKKDLDILKNVEDSLKTIIELQEQGDNLTKDAVESEKKKLELAEAITNQHEEDIAIQKENKNILSALVSYKLDMLKFAGATNKQLAQAEITYKNLIAPNRGINEKLKERLNLQKAINTSRLSDFKLSSETMKLYQIAQKEGITTARDIARVLKGDISFDVAQYKDFFEIFKEYFPNIVKAQEALDFFQKGAARGIDIKERVVVDALEEGIKDLEAKIKLQIGVDIAFPEINIKVDAGEDAWQLFASKIKESLDNPNSDLARAFQRFVDSL